MLFLPILVVALGVVPSFPCAMASEQNPDRQSSLSPGIEQLLNEYHGLADSTPNTENHHDSARPSGDDETRENGQVSEYTKAYGSAAFTFMACLWMIHDFTSVVYFVAGTTGGFLLHLPPPLRFVLGAGCATGYILHQKGMLAQWF